MEVTLYGFFIALVNISTTDDCNRQNKKGRSVRNWNESLQHGKSRNCELGR